MYNDGVEHRPGLLPDEFKELKLAGKTLLSDDAVLFEFELPNKTDHTGCLLGQYVQVNMFLIQKKISNSYIFEF